MSDDIEPPGEDQVSPPPDDEEPAPPPPEPYSHEPALVEAAARLLDSAMPAEHDYAAASAVRSGASAYGWDDETPIVRALELTALYQLRTAHSGEAPGCRLGPEDDDRIAYPARISDVPDAVVELWTSLAERCEEPAAQARVHDLLCERKVPDRRAHALAAVDAYLAVAEARGPDLRATDVLVRAWTLARQFQAWDRLALVQQRLLQRAQQALERSGETPGIVLPLLEAAAAEPLRRQPVKATAAKTGPSVDDLLTLAAKTYSKSYVLARVLDLQRGRADDPNALRELDRRQVQALLDEADAAPHAFVRQSHLTAAIRVARDRGVTDLADLATRLLQGIPAADLKLQPISSSMSIPASMVEQYLAPFSTGHTWRDALGYFLCTPPPTGRYADLERQERELSNKFVLRGLFSTVRLMEGRLPKATVAPGSEEARQAEIAQIASIGGMFQADLMAEGLRRMVGSHGIAPAEDVAVWLMAEAGCRDPRLAQRLAEALVLFWERRYDACLHVIVPRIETALRSLLRECDVAVFRTQVGAAPGGYIGLQPLISALRAEHFDEDWAYFLQWLLLDPGLNLRNDVAHGLVGHVAPATAALALRAAGLLILLAADPEALGWDGDLDGRQATETTAPTVLRSREELHALLRTPVESPIDLTQRRGAIAVASRAVAVSLRAAAHAAWSLARRFE